MLHVRLALIVEGHGDVHAAPVLVRRLAVESLGLPMPEILAVPHRLPKGKMISGDGLERAVELQANKVGRGGAILILLDADRDCPKEVAANLLSRARAKRPDRRIEVVLAKVEYENWFIAAIESLAGKYSVQRGLTAPPNPEAIRDAKGWISARMSQPYKETVDQKELTVLFDLALAASKSTSFAKLRRSVKALLSRRRKQL